MHCRMAASMRPGDFSPGNTYNGRYLADGSTEASMRPGDFSPGNRAAPAERHEGPAGFQ